MVYNHLKKYLIKNLINTDRQKRKNYLKMFLASLSYLNILSIIYLFYKNLFIIE